jgi:hypothetical protein
MRVDAGENASQAITRLVQQLVPSFCVFNGIRLEADHGATVESVLVQWNAACAERAQRFEAEKAADDADRQARFVAQIVRAERARIVALIRERATTEWDRARAELSRLADDLEAGT